MKIIGEKSLSSFINKVLLVVLIAIVAITIVWGAISLYTTFNEKNTNFIKGKTFHNTSYCGLAFRVKDNENIQLSASFKTLSFIYMIILIFIIYYLKKIFANLKEEILFSYDNSNWLFKIGAGVTILAIIGSFLNYSFGWILHNYLVAKGVNVDVVFNLNIITIFIGIVIIIFSQIYKKATDIAEEHKLTI